MSTIIVVSGPAGSGKGTVIAGALKQVPEYRLAKSLTTRAPRPEDTMYDYATEAEFEAAFERGELIERNYHFQAWYGKRIPSDDGAWLYEMDVEGAEETKKMFPQTKKVLIVPPEPLRETISKRMLKRAQETGKEMNESEFEIRLERAEYELKFSREHGVDLEILNAEGKQAESIAQLMALMRQELKQS